MNVLINSTVLSNFAAIDRLTLLQALYGTVYISQAVYEEIQVGLEEGYPFLAAIDAHIFPFHQEGWLRLVNIEGEKEFEIYQRIPSKLHRGEAATLAIAAYRQWGFLTDDRAARSYAKTLGVEVSGTLGVLAQLVKRNHLSIAEANFQLGQMASRARYRSPITDIALLLD